MKIALYILGLLVKNGSQHGYNLQKIINKKFAPFTIIKMPSLYYHLEILHKNNYISVDTVQEGNRPEKNTYSITEKGINYFREIFEKAVNKDFEIEFLTDAIFLLWDTLSYKEIKRILMEKLAKVEKKALDLTLDKKKYLENIKNNKTSIEILFRHHEHHYNAEITWLKETINILNKKYDNEDENFLQQKT